jgi:hypothetical protein
MASIPAPPPSTVYAFGDDFNGTALDLTRWLYTNGTAYPGGPAQFGTGEVEENRPQNTSVGNGVVRITPTRDPSGKWWSSRIESRKAFLPAEGQVMTISSRLALPNVSGVKAEGYWPAFWVLSSALRANRWIWPANGEMDIAESVNGYPWSNSVLHCGSVTGGPCDEPNGINTNGRPCAGSSCWGNFHTYKFVWDRVAAIEVMRWYIDGVNTLTVRQDDPRMAGTTWTNMQQYGFNIILNVAISGAYPNKFGKPVTAATEPGHPMQVDYVTVGYSGTATPTPTPTPTPPGTHKFQIEGAADKSGIVATAMTGADGGLAADIKGGAYAHFSRVDFGAGKLISLRLKSNAPAGVSGTLSVHLDTKDGPLVGTPQSIGNGFSTAFRDLALANASGVHDLWCVANTGSQTFAQVDYILVS